MVDKSCVLQIFGSLMKHPQYLSESDKYNLTPDDFYSRLDKYIFVAIDSLYRNGASRIHPIDVEELLLYVITKFVELPLGTNLAEKYISFPFAVDAGILALPTDVPFMLMSK